MPVVGEKAVRAETWHEPSAQDHSETAGYGKVRVRAWSGLHPKTRR